MGESFRIGGIHKLQPNLNVENECLRIQAELMNRELVSINKIK